MKLQHLSHETLQQRMVVQISRGGGAGMHRLKDARSKLSQHPLCARGVLGSSFLQVLVLALQLALQRLKYSHRHDRRRDLVVRM